MTPNAEVPMQQPGWFSRNWKWLLPVGCMVPLMCCGVFGAGTYFAVTKVIQSSGAYTGALALVNGNPEVDAALGTPVVPGFGMSGSVNENNSSGSADFTVPIEGPKGKGSLRVVATRNRGEWTFQLVEVAVGAKVIDVLPPEEEPAGD